MTFRADAAFAKPEIYEALEQRGVDYVIRIPANKNLELEIEDILFRPPGRPSAKPSPVRSHSPTPPRALTPPPRTRIGAGVLPRRPTPPSPHPRRSGD